MSETAQEMIKMLAPIVMAHVVVLALIIAVIKRLLLGDTMQAVGRIKQVEDEVRKKEEGIRKEIDEHEQEFEKQKLEAEQELNRQREASEKELSTVRDQITSEAKKEAENILDQAKRNEEKYRQQIAQDMEEKAVDYGSEVFKLVFSERMTDSLDQQFIEELLDALAEVDAGSITVDSNEAEFTTCRTMNPEQKTRMEALLKEKFDANISIDEKIDETLISGIIFKIGSLEIDGSLRNRFQEAAAEVTKTAQV